MRGLFYFIFWIFTCSRLLKLSLILTYMQYSSKNKNYIRKLGCLPLSALILIIEWLIFLYLFFLLLHHHMDCLSSSICFNIVKRHSWLDQLAFKSKWSLQSLHSHSLFQLFRIPSITFLNLMFQSCPCLVTLFIILVTSSIDMLFKSSLAIVVASAWFSRSRALQNISSTVLSWSPWSQGTNNSLNLTHSSDKSSIFEI